MINLSPLQFSQITGLCMEGSCASLIDKYTSPGQRQYVPIYTNTECSALMYSSTCKLTRTMKRERVCVRVWACLCFCITVYRVPVSTLHRGFWMQFLSLQNDSFHLCRIQCLMGIRFSKLGNFCRDTQHCEQVQCYGFSYLSIPCYQRRVHWQKILGRSIQCQKKLWVQPLYLQV